MRHQRPNTPLVDAEKAIERATVEALRRQGIARTMGAWLQAQHLMADIRRGQSHCRVPWPGLSIEFKRLCGLTAVRAAAVDDDMQALHAELVATIDALSGV